MKTKHIIVLLLTTVSLSSCCPFFEYEGSYGGRGHYNSGYYGGNYGGGHYEGRHYGGEHREEVRYGGGHERRRK